MLTRRHALSTLAGGAAAALGPPCLGAVEKMPRAAYEKLLGDDKNAFLEGIVQLRARGGMDLVAGLIMTMRFARIDDGEISTLLADVTGASEPKTWFEWMLWQEAHPEVIPHPDYIDFKREFFYGIDPNFSVFFSDPWLERDAMRIRLEEVTWGGVRKDGIPALTNPTLIPAAEADFMVGSDLVFGVEVDGDIRAYPLRIMGWHEMFNDTIGGVPLSLAYCTLCGAGILFESTAPGRAEPFVFGTSGFLYRSNKLMYDDATHSLWNLFTGEPVVGPLADSGIVLKQRPVVIEPWVRWVARHPDSQVLSIDTGYDRYYGSGYVYEQYFRSPKLMFPAIVDQTRAAQKDHVFGIRTFGGAKAWPVTAFEGGQVINDKVADLNVVLIGDRLGRTVRAYDRGERLFEAGFNGDVRSDGAVWEVTEHALIGPDKALAPRVAGHVAYWFAWDGYLGAQSEWGG